MIAQAIWDRVKGPVIGEMDDSNKCDEGVCLGLNCKSLQDYINYVQKLRTESEKRAREERRRNK